MKIRNDFILIACLVIVAGLLFAYNYFMAKSDGQVEIYLNGTLYKVVSLEEDNTVQVNHTNTVMIENGKVYMKEAICPDQICVKQGKITKSGQDIVCLPNKVVVKVIGNNESLDGIVR